MKVYRSSIELISSWSPQDKDQSIESVKVLLDDNVCLDNVGLVIHATGYKPIVPINFDPPSYRLALGLSGLVGTCFWKR